MTLTRPDAFFTDTRPSVELPEVPNEIPRHRGEGKRPWVRLADDTGSPPAVARERHRDGSPITVLADPKDSRRGRYYTRASSYGSLLDDKYKIQRATQRRIVWAMGRHHELVVQSQALGEQDDPGVRDQLEALADKANEYGRGDAAATRGTAFHRLRERRDQGENLSYLDPLTLRGLDVWTELLTPFELIGSEQFVVNDELEAAGTYDALLLAQRTITIRHPKTGEVLGAVERGESVVGDLKSGKWGPEWFGVTYSCQAWVYASGRPYSHAGGREAWPLMTDPSQRWAVIPYVSLDRLDDAGLHWIDLKRARHACELVAQVKEVRADPLKFVAHQDEPMPAVLAAAGQRSLPIGSAGCAQHGPHPMTVDCPTCLYQGGGALLVGLYSERHLFDLIAKADGKVALSRLWAEHAAVWTPEHTVAGQARLAQLADGTG